MNVEIGTDAAQFLSWEYLFPSFGTVSLQCGINIDWKDWYEWYEVTPLD
jgi:hypothetical protein